MRTYLTQNCVKLCLLGLTYSLSACAPVSPAKEFDFTGPIVIEIYADDGRIKATEMAPSDLEISRMRDIVSNPAMKWSYDINSYAPHYRIVGPRINLNCWNDKIIANYLDRSGVWRQLSTDFQECEKRLPPLRQK